MRRKGNIVTRNLKVIGIVILAILVANYVISGNTVTTGYGGLTAEIVNVQGKMESTSVTTNDGLIATWDTDGYWSPWPFAVNPTGVTMEIQGRANIMGIEEAGAPIKEVIDNGDGTWTQKMWAQSIVKCEFGVRVATSGTGLESAQDTIFTIRLQENQFDLFTKADDVRAYIIETYVIEVTEESTNMKLSPSSAGQYVKLTPLRDSTVPDWILEAGYQQPISQMESATFELRVDFAQPTSFLWSDRAEVSASWVIGVDMLTFGYWEQVGPNKYFDPPTDDWWANLLPVLPALILGGTIAAVILVVFVTISRTYIMSKVKA